MRTYLVALVVLLSAVAVAQTCVVPAPPVPPTPRVLYVTLPVDGGTVGCTASAPMPGGPVPADYPISNAKCAQAVGIAKQAAANDNGWNDGGAP